MHSKCVRYATVLFLSLVSLFAQQLMLQGEFLAEGAGTGDKFIIELYDSGKHVPLERIIASSGSRFQFYIPKDTQCTLRVLTERGELLHEEAARGGYIGNTLTVHLGNNQVEKVVPGTISASRLRHKIPSKAQKEYRKAAAMTDKGDIENAILHLRKAVEIDPEFMEAHNNLACEYVRADRLKEAVSEYEIALKIDPTAGKTYTNLAVALLRMGDVKNAEPAASKAAELDASSSASHYVFGLARYAAHRYDKETLRQLDLAAVTYPTVKAPADRLRKYLNTLH